MLKKWFVISLVSVFLASCTPEGGLPGGGSEEVPAAQKAISKAVFSDSVTDFNVAVYFEPGAEPYEGQYGLPSPRETWDFTKKSFEALFNKHTPRNINVPYTLAEMNAISAQSQSSWTYNELKSLGDSIAPPLADGTQVTTTLFFVNGNYDGNTNVLGIHLTGTRYAFVFKDIVESMGSNQRQVEQAVAVHEIGHLIGLVNSGVPMVANHEDSAHPHHSNDSEDVMYWAVESASDIGDFITGILGGNQQLFGTNSLNDAQAYHP